MFCSPLLPQGTAVAPARLAKLAAPLAARLNLVDGDPRVQPRALRRPVFISGAGVRACAGGWVNESGKSGDSD